LNRVPRLTDDRALSDAESSLVQMVYNSHLESRLESYRFFGLISSNFAQFPRSKVDNFLAEVEPGLSAEERATRAATLDPKLISPAYEAELKKNVASLYCSICVKI